MTAAKDFSPAESALQAPCVREFYAGKMFSPTHRVYYYTWASQFSCTETWKVLSEWLNRCCRPFLLWQGVRSGVQLWCFVYFLRPLWQKQELISRSLFFLHNMFRPSNPDHMLNNWVAERHNFESGRNGSKHPMLSLSGCSVLIPSRFEQKLKFRPPFARLGARNRNEPRFSFQDRRRRRNLHLLCF